MNIVQLTADLTAIIRDIKEGHIDRATADTLINAYGKIGANVRNQVAYLALKQGNPSLDRIDFYEAGLTPAPLVVENTPASTNNPTLPEA